MYEEFICKNQQFSKIMFFSLCIPVNLNQTAVGLFWLGKKKKTAN